jgi:hypothetical protein
MAEAVAIAVAEIVGTAWAAEAALYVIGNAAAINSAAVLFASTSYGGYQQRKAERGAMLAARASLKDREVMIRSGVPPRRWIYGRDRVSGQVAYIESTGDKKQFLHLVVTLAAHECDAIEEVWFNDVILPEPDVDGFIQSGEFARDSKAAGYQPVTIIGNSVTLTRAATRITGITVTNPDQAQDEVTGWSHTPGSATITGIPAADGTTGYVNYEYSTGGPRVRIKKHLGGAGQAADADLVAESDGKWTSAHKGTGVCYVYVRLEWDKDVFGSVGIPEIKCVLRGRKVYDPRTEVTAWSENTALCVADWLQRPEGLNAAPEEVPESEIIAAANICDEVIDLNLAGTETQARYTFNGSFTADESPRSVLDDMLQAMAGKAVWVQGRWLVRPGAYRTPEPDVTDDMLAGAGVTIIPRASRAELFNAVRATYRDPDQGWAEVQAPLVTNSMYEAEDGGVRKVRTIQLSSAMDAWRAQRLAKIELERARQALTVQFVTNLSGYDMAPTDHVPLVLSRYGWGAGKVVEISDRTYNTEGTISYIGRETAAGVWAWNYGQATLVDLAPNTALPNPYTPPAALTGMDVASGTVHLLRQADGSLLTRAYVTWDASEDAFVREGGRIDVQWHRADLEEWQAMPAHEGTDVAAYVAPVSDGTAVLFRIRQVNAIGRASDWTYMLHQVVGKTEPPSDVTGFDAVSVIAGIVTLVWDACPDIDYNQTEVREVDGDWGSDAVPPQFRGKATDWKAFVVTADTYTWYARHIDESGNVSDNSATATIVVAPGDLAGGGGAAAPTYRLVLTPRSVTLQADQYGVVQDWAAATSALAVLDGTGAPVTGAWAFSPNAVGVAAEITGTTLAISGPTNSATYYTNYNYLRFLGQYNGNALDTSIYGRVPTYSGIHAVPRATDGVFGGALEILPAGSGVNNTTRMMEYGPDPALIWTGGTLFMSVRVKFRSYPSGSFEKRIFGNNRKYLLISSLGGLPVPAFRIFAGPSASGGGTVKAISALGVPANELSLNTWYELAATISAGKIRLFRNGVEVASHIVTLNPTDLEDVNTGLYLRVGCTEKNLPIDVGYQDHGMDGWVDECIYQLDGPVPTSVYATNPHQVSSSRVPTPAYVDVTATQLGEADLVERFDLTVINAQKTTYLASCLPGQITLPADYYGTITSYTGTSIACSLKIDGIETIGFWSIKWVANSTNTALPNTSPTITVNGNVVQITNLAVGSRYYSGFTLRLLFVRAGYPNQMLDVPVVVQRAALPSVQASVQAAITVAGDSAGNVPAGNLPVTVQAVAVEGSTNRTTSYSWSTSVTTGLTASVSSGGLVSLTAMTQSVDAGTITLTGTRSGFPNITLYISVLKTKLLLPSGAVVNPMPAKTVYTDSSGTAYARIRYNTDGTIETWDELTAAWIAAGNWYNPTTPGIGNTHYIRMTSTNIIDATYLTGTRDAWLQMNSARTWEAQTPGGGTYSQMSATALISATAGGAILGQGPVTLIAQSL